MTQLEKELLVIQHKIESLNAEVANLVALTAMSASADSLTPETLAERPVVSRSSMKTAVSHVGINRFRQLKQESA